MAGPGGAGAAAIGRGPTRARACEREGDGVHREVRERGGGGCGVREGFG